MAWQRPARSEGSRGGGLDGRSSPLASGWALALALAACADDPCSNGGCNDGFSVVLESRGFEVGTHPLSLNADGAVTSCNLEVGVDGGQQTCGAFEVSVVAVERCAGGGYGAPVCTPTGDYEQIIESTTQPATLGIEQRAPGGGSLSLAMALDYRPFRPGGDSCQVGCVRATERRTLP